MTPGEHNDNASDGKENVERTPAEEKVHSRRTFLQRSGIFMAALGTYGASAIQTSSADIHQASKAHPLQQASELGTQKPYRIDLDVVDQVDGYLVVRPSFQVNLNGSVKTVPDVRLSDGLSIQITQGEAKVTEDPYNGDILIAPTGTIPIKARGVLGPMTTAPGGALGVGNVGANSIVGSPVLIGEETEIGFTAQNIPRAQLSIVAAGGGACVSSTSLSNTASIPQQLTERFTGMGISGDSLKQLAQGYHFKLRVRACVAANVIPRSALTREIVWQHGLYYAFDPVLGRMRLHYNPAFRSRTVMHSDGALTAGHNFFPASGMNQLYFILNFLDLGYHAFNKEPMNLHFSNTQWPPYSTPLDIEKPVQFYNLDNPEEVILTVYQNTLQLYDYAAVDIENLHYEVDARGLIRTSWLIRNQATTPIQGQWFALGNFVQSNDLPDQGSYHFAPAGTDGDTLKVDFVGRLSKSSLTQMITMNLVSYDDPVVVGSKGLNFRYPQ
jgi:hypothetical protein